MGKTLLRWFTVGLFVGLGAGAVVGLALSRGIKLPAVEALTSFRPAAATQVRAKDGSLLATFSREKRIPLPPEQIPAGVPQRGDRLRGRQLLPPHRRRPRGIVRAALRNVISFGSSTQGASTITQQLARGLFLTPEKKLTRKVKEALLAIEIEQRFSKDEILTLYVNQVYFGHGTYGVEAASRFFFGKPAAQLTLPEAALLAGHRPAQRQPVADSPARRGRWHGAATCSTRMLDEKMIVARGVRGRSFAARSASSRTTTAPSAPRTSSRRCGARSRTASAARQMLEGGLEVDDHARPGSSRRSPRTPYATAWSSCSAGSAGRERGDNLLADRTADAGAWRDPSWRFLKWQRGELVYAVVEEVRAELASLRIGDRTARLVPAGAKWTGQDQPHAAHASRATSSSSGCTRCRRRPTCRSRSSSRASPRPRARCWCSTTAPARSLRWSAASTSSAPSGTARCRPRGSADRRSSRSSSSRRSSAGSRPTTSSSTPRCCFPTSACCRPTARSTTTCSFEGMITLRYALEHSLNASAAKLQQLVTGEAVIDAARRLGITPDARARLVARARFLRGHLARAGLGVLRDRQPRPGRRAVLHRLASATTRARCCSTSARRCVRRSARTSPT